MNFGKISVTPYWIPARIAYSLQLIAFRYFWHIYLAQKSTIHEWWFLKPYIGLFRNYWKFQGSINEITSECSSCSLLQ